MSTLSFSFENGGVLNIHLYNTLLFSFNNDHEFNKKVLNRELDHLVKKMIAASDFRGLKVVPPEWLSLLCKQLDETVPVEER